MSLTKGKQYHYFSGMHLRPLVYNPCICGFIFKQHASFCHRHFVLRYAHEVNYIQQRKQTMRRNPPFQPSVLMLQQTTQETGDTPTNQNRSRPKIGCLRFIMPNTGNRSFCSKMIHFRVVECLKRILHKENDPKYTKPAPYRFDNFHTSFHR